MTDPILDYQILTLGIVEEAIKKVVKTSETSKEETEVKTSQD